MICRIHHSTGAFEKIDPEIGTMPPSISISLMSFIGSIRTAGHNFKGFHRPDFTFVFDLKPLFAATKFWITLLTALLGNSIYGRVICGNAFAAGIFENAFAEIIALTQGPIQITVLGSTTCPNQMMINGEYPADMGWYEIGSLTYQPLNTFSLESIPDSIPQPTHAIMIGGGCDLPLMRYVILNGTITLLHDIFPLEGLVFDATLTQTGGSYLSDLILIAPEENYRFQCYYDNNALVGDNGLGLNHGAANYNECDYTLLVNNFDQKGCYFLEVRVTETELLPPAFTANLISGCAPLTVQFSPSKDCPIDYCEWQIFNRWVGKVFPSADAQMKWNGYSELVGECFAESGLYACMHPHASALTALSDRFIQKGHFNLLR